MALPWLTEPAPLPLGEQRPRRAVGIAGIGASVPETVVPNRVMADRLGIDEEWIVRRTGIRSRHIAGEDDLLVDHATVAARHALAQAGVSPGEIDLIVVATVTPDRLLPNVAPTLAHRLGAARAGGFDLGAACTGFLSALAVAAGQIEASRCDCVLVVGADFMSRVTDPDDRGTAAVFADGAGAAVLTTVQGESRLGPIVLGADGRGGELISAERSGTVRMSGQEVFRAAVARLAEVTVEATFLSRVALEDIDLFVYHQANGRILSAVAERLSLPRDRVIDCIGEYGNTSAATLPLALAFAQERKLVTPGDRVLLAAFGAGFTWGATVCEWSVA